jgi:hypothetical protein
MIVWAMTGQRSIRYTVVVRHSSIHYSVLKSCSPRCYIVRHPLIEFYRLIVSVL